MSGESFRREPWLAGLAPAESLASLTHDDLYQVLSALPGAKVSRSKGERLEPVSTSTPASHLRQLKRYIRDSGPRVACFLIIVPEVDEEAGHRAARLKVESGTDTDVALIPAEDLVWITEMWQDEGREEAFNSEVFDTTGILDRPTLEQRIGWLL